MSPAMEGS